MPDCGGAVEQIEIKLVISISCAMKWKCGNQCLAVKAPRQSLSKLISKLLKSVGKALYRNEIM